MCWVSLFYRVPNCYPAKRKTARDVTNKRGGSNKSEMKLANQMIPRLPEFLFKFIQKQPPEVLILLILVYARKLKSCSY